MKRLLLSIIAILVLQFTQAQTLSLSLPTDSIFIWEAVNIINNSTGFDSYLIDLDECEYDPLLNNTCNGNLINDTLIYSFETAKLHNIKLYGLNSNGVKADSLLTSIVVYKITPPTPTTSACCPNIYNGDFENFTSLPTTIHQIEKATPWTWKLNTSTGTTVNSVEYFYPHPSLNTLVNIPNNFLGYQQPHSGLRYAGLTVYLQNNNWREYLLQQLPAALTPGVTYEVSMWVNLANKARYSIKNLGIYFADITDTTAFSLVQSFFLYHNNASITPDITNDPTVLLNDTINWVEIKGYYTPTANNLNGIIIGNFDDYNDNTAGSSTQNVFQNYPYSSNLFNIAYYYIDKVCIKPVPNEYQIYALNDTICPADTVTLSVLDSLNNTVGNNLDILWSTGDTTANITVTSGTYWVSVSDSNGCFINADSITIASYPTASSSISITACDTYTWPTNGTSYTTSGTYTNITSNATGCDSVIILNLTINPLPSLAITGNPNVCVGDIVTYSVVASGITNYQWTTTGNLLTSSTSNTINVQWNSVTPLQSVSVSYTDANGCTGTTTLAITVNSAPVVANNTSAPTAFCYNPTGFIDLTQYVTATPSSGTWTFINSATGAVVTNPMPSTMGFFDIVGTYTIGGCTASLDGIAFEVFNCCQIPNAYNSANGNATTMLAAIQNSAPHDIDAALITIAGTFTVDTDLTWEDCQIYLAEDAKIEILPGKTLKIDESYLQACDTLLTTPMWDGIYLDGSTTKLITYGSTIRDAKNAIYSTNEAVVQLEGSQFINNKKNVFISNNHVGLCSIQSNTFKKIAPLHAPFTGQNTDFGLSLFWCSDIVVGETMPTGNPKNIFDGLTTGIYLETTTTIISHNEFKNLKEGVVSYPDPLFPVPQKVEIGLSKATYDNTFYNCYIGIVAEATEAHIINNEFDGSFNFRAISIADAVGFNTPVPLTIKDNWIAFYDEGIHVYNIKNANLSIKENHLQFGIAGITVAKATNANVGNIINIFNNTLRDYFQKGIHITQLFEARIGNNALYNNELGILVSDANETYIIANNIENFGAQRIAGISLVNSMGNTLRCNKMNNMVHCLYVQGFCPSRLHFNTFGNAKNGITLDFYASIGQQGSNTSTNDNKWTANAYGPNPTDNKHTLCINNSDGSLSPFFVKSFPPYWNEFNDYVVPANPVPYSFPSNLPWPGPNPCGIGQTPMLMAIDTTLSFDTTLASSVSAIPTTGTYNNSLALWLEKEGVYSELQQDSTLVLNAELQNFKDSVALTDMGELERIKEEIRDEDLNVAKTRNANIMPANAIETTTKDVYTILIRTLIEERKVRALTTDELDTLEYIAYLCPFTHGRSVYTARAICSYLDTAFVSYYNACEAYYSENSSSRITMNSPSLPTINIYPNPVLEKVHITANLGKEENALVYIIDSKGQVVAESSIKNNSELQLDVSTLSSGLYIVDVRTNKNKLLYKEKLSILGR